jgi:hypothetical protein
MAITRSTINIPLKGLSFSQNVQEMKTFKKVMFSLNFIQYNDILVETYS